MLKDQDSHPYLRAPSAALILENGDTFWGNGLGPLKADIGELCFNTSQTGYQETLTDPSYAKQIITFTFPHIGIVGTNKIDHESKKIYASGCVINQPLSSYSNWRAENDLDFFFKQNNVPCIFNIDTRQLTRRLANEGAFNAAIVNFGKDPQKLDQLKIQLNKWSGLENLDLATIVSTEKNYLWNEGVWNKKLNTYQTKNSNNYSIACFDFGIKQNILRNLYSLNFTPTVISAKSSVKEVLATHPDGIFLSNGPGDPAATGKYAIKTIKTLIKKNIPIFGICLGHQILALALGAKTKKMKLGHRGANHPVKNLINNNVEITSQNHGFEIVKEGMPKNIEITHKSLFDNCIEGIRLKNKPVFSVQYHPESNPGPQDSVYLFKEFINCMKKNAKKKRY